MTAMSRPIITDGDSGRLPGTARPIEYPIATVDAPDAYYTAARGQLDGQTIIVMNRDFEEVGRYELDEPPTFVGDAEKTITGMTDGQVIVLRLGSGCNCRGQQTTKVMKNEEAADA